MAKILYFGRLSDTAGCAEAEIELPAHVTTADALVGWLGSTNPLLGEALVHASVRVAINQHVAPDRTAVLSNADEIAFMPPMSGG